MNLKTILTIILSFLSVTIYSQSVAAKKCQTCGKALALCEYKGKHPSLNSSRTSTTHSNQHPSSLNGHEWVDLGLPSGTKWATANVGASSPSDYGSYFAWGETSPKNNYDWSNLKYCLDNRDDKFSKYVIDSKYGNVDGKKELDLSDDAAHVNWGNGWRMPSKSQLNELLKKCKWTWTSMEGYNGYKVVGPNGNFIFLPAAGYRLVYDLNEAGSFGYYWSRSLYLEDQGLAYELSFYYVSPTGSNASSRKRVLGYCVRPVLTP